MGLMDRVERGGLRAQWNNADDRWYTSAPVGGTFAGFPISADTAQRVSAVFACNSLILETVASLPCHLHRRLDNGGKERARDHRWYRPLRFQPNTWMTSMDFFSYGQGHLGLRGTVVNQILDDPLRPQLVPLHPATVTVEQLESGRLRVRHRDPRGVERTLTQDEVLIVRDTSTDGITGVARATLAREAISVAAAGEASVGSWFKNDATGRVVVKTAQPLKPEARADLRQMIQENYSGPSNRGKAWLLSSGLDVQELGAHDDAAFLIDPRKFQVADIARFWRVPGFMIGLEEKSTSWGTGIEQQMHGFIRHTIRPWLKRWEQSLARDLLDESERDEFFFEFLLDDLLAGDLKSTVDALAVEHEHGALSRNEWRVIRNRNPVAGGDVMQEQIRGAAPNRAGAPTPANDPGEEEDEKQAQLVPAPMLADAAARISGEEIREVGKRAGKAAEDGLKFAAWAQEFFRGLAARTVTVVSPLVESYGFEPWVTQEAARRVEATAVGALGAAGVPEGWLEQRKAEVAQILDETFRAAAAVRRQEAA